MSATGFEHSATGRKGVPLADAWLNWKFQDRAATVKDAKDALELFRAYQITHVIFSAGFDKVRRTPLEAAALSVGTIRARYGESELVELDQGRLADAGTTSGD